MRQAVAHVELRGFGRAEHDARPRDDRAGGGAKARTQFLGDDLSQRGFARLARPGDRNGGKPKQEAAGQLL